VDINLEHYCILTHPLDETDAMRYDLAIIFYTESLELRCMIFAETGPFDLSLQTSYRNQNF
jgi:hypothetical protein